MDIVMQECDDCSHLEVPAYDAAIFGPAVDDRGIAAVNYLSEISTESHIMQYNPDDFIVSLNNYSCEADECVKIFKKFEDKKIILEATTLGFVEIFYCCRYLQENNIQSIDIIYVEPKRYSKTNRLNLLNKRDFDLSDEFPGYRAIPGATMLLSDRESQIGIFFLGYEERRLDRALEDFQMIRPSKCNVAFGVPAFKPGWEMDAFANNIRVIRDKNIRGGIHYCGAENPQSAIDLLNEIYCGLKKNERMFIAPLGTKPNGIGAAVFASIFSDVGILYDHPKRKAGRSKRVSTWHHYKIQFGAVCE